MRERRNILRYVVEFDVSEREVKDTDGTSFVIETYALRLNGNVFGSYDLEKRDKRTEESGYSGDGDLESASLQAYRDYVTKHLEAV